jgi:hypothetical protein
MRPDPRIDPATGVDPLKGWDFFRCFKCHRLLTRLEVLDGLKHRQGQSCPCGSLNVSPSNGPAAVMDDASRFAWWLYMLTPWRHWSIWKFTLLRELGRA